MNPTRIASYVIDFVAGRAFMTAQKKLSEEFHVRQVIPEDVARCAASLEATAIMIDKAPGDTPVNVVFTRDELVAFVCYMRQLDTDYKSMQREYQSCADELEQLKDGDRKTAQAAAKNRTLVMPSVQRPRAGYTGRYEDEHAHISARQLQILEKTARIRQALGPKK